MSKLYLLIFFLILFSLFLEPTPIFAYITKDTQYVKIQRDYVIKNESNHSDSFIVDTMSSNVENAPYSILIQNHFSTNIINEPEIDSKGNVFQQVEVGTILGKNDVHITYDYIAKVSTIDYQLHSEKTKPIGDYDPSLEVYLSPSARIESDHPLILEKANNIRNSISNEKQNNPYEVTKSIFDYVQTHMSYTYDDRANNKGALHALSYGVGNCEDYSSYMVALLRASNIPARTVTGFKVEPNRLKNSIEGLNLIDPNYYTRHMWVEAYINGYGWVAFDPTFISNTMIKSKVKDIYGNFLKADHLPITIKYYKSISVPNYKTFGKLPNYYVKEQYDLNDYIHYVQTSLNTVIKFKFNYIATLVN